MKYLALILLLVAGARLVYMCLSVPKINLDAFQRIETTLMQSQAKASLSILHHDLFTELKKSESAEAFLALGVFYSVYGFSGEAGMAFDYGRQKDPLNFELCYAYGNLAATLGHLDQASEAFDQAASVAPDQISRAESHYRLGLLALREENQALAAQYFKQANQDGSYYAAIYELARIALYQEDLDAFKPYYAKLMEAYAMSIEFYNLSLRANEIFPEIEAVAENAERRAMLSYDTDADRDEAIRAAFGISLRDVQNVELDQSQSQAVELELRKASHDPERIQLGKRVFTQAQCVMCHAANGSGNIGPNLLDNYWLYGNSLSAIIESVSNGRKHNMMPAQKYNLSRQEIEDVAIYVVSLNREAAKNQTHKTGKAAEGVLQALDY